MDDFLKTLHDKEKELRLELEQTSIFKKWEGVKTTIALFENGQSSNGVSNNPQPGIQQPATRVAIPKAYHNDELTWNEKVIFALSKLGEGSVADIVDFLKKQGAPEDVEFLTKRVGVTASKLNVNEKINSRLEGRKGIYSL